MFPMGEDSKLKIAVIGCGVIGSALAQHFANHDLTLFDRNSSRAEELALKTGGKVSDHFAKANLIILAIKPQDLPNFKASFSSNQLIISVLAGVTTDRLKTTLGIPHVLRIMPNIAMRYGKGVIGIVEDSQFSTKDKEQINTLFSKFGLLLWIPESKIDALTAISGSGPAFILQIIDSLMKSAINRGFTKKEAKNLVIHTIQGALALLQQSDLEPSELISQIAAPGGTTEVGLAEMKKHKVDEALEATINVTIKRSEELQ